MMLTCTYLLSVFLAFFSFLLVFSGTTVRLVYVIYRHCGSSLTAGEFICNYVYFHTLAHCAAVPAGRPVYGLFVHVPLFDAIPMPAQLKLVQDLLRCLVAGKYFTGGVPVAVSPAPAAAAGGTGESH
jgi:hypothetical protein